MADGLLYFRTGIQLTGVDVPVLRLALLILSFCAVCRPASAEMGELRVALWVTEVEALARTPAAIPRVPGLAGLNEDLAREICRRINARCRFENVVFADILPGIETHRFDLGFGNFLRTPEREARVAFSDAIWSSSSRLLGRPDRDRLLRERTGAEPSLDKLRQVRIGSVLGTRQHAYLESIASGQGLKMSGFRTMAEALAKLGEGQLDFCLVPVLPAYDLLRREAPGRFEFVGPPLVEHGLGGSIHIALVRDREPLRLAVNSALAALRADGTYHRLVRRHFPFTLE